MRGGGTHDLIDRSLYLRDFGAKTDIYKENELVDRQVGIFGITDENTVLISYIAKICNVFGI